MGLSIEEIAEHITRVGRGKGPAMVAVPPVVTFPEDYSISRQGCDKSFKRAIARQPALELGAYRKLDNARTEEMYLNLQPGIRKGNPRAIEVGIKVLDHTAKVNGYASASEPQNQRKPLGDTDDRPTIAAIRRILKDRAIDVTSLSQPLITGIDSGLCSDPSAASGDASTDNNSLVSDDDGVALPAVITWHDIEIVRAGLEEQRNMKECLASI